MGTLSEEQFAKVRLKVASSFARLSIRKLREMHAKFPKPRLFRLPKEARALKSLVAEARAAGLVQPASGTTRRRR
jgi:hypothetical protein